MTIGPGIDLAMEPGMRIDGRSRVEDFERVHALRIFANASTWFRVKLYMMIPMALFFSVTLAASHFPPIRVGLVLATFAASLFVHKYAFDRLHAESIDRAIHVHFCATLFAQLFVISATGGIRSPLMPLLVAGGLVTRLMLGRRFDRRILLVSLGSPLLMALLPSSWTGPTIASPYWQVLAIGGLASAAFQTRDAILRMTEVTLCSGEQLVRLREQSLREAEERLYSLQSISARLAHELKNPLSAIKGLVQLHARSEKDADGREQLAVVTSEIARVELILRDYLSYSRPLNDLRPERIALDELLADVVAVLSGRAQGAGVRLRDDSSVAVVYGDPRRLKEALINLVSNAIEATPAGGSVVVGVRDCADRAEILIRDTGVGIPPEVLARVGTPFFTTRPDGTGLGVVLARNVVVQHGGSLEFDSEPGRGTTVAVKLPFLCKQEARLHGHRAAG